MTIHRVTITNNLCFSFALEDLARKWTTSESQEECGKRVEKQPKNRPPPTPTGMKGGCSPQNNLSIANQIDAACMFARADFINGAG